MAWQRTGLALLGVGAVLLHVGNGLLPLAVGALDLAAGVLVGAVVGPVRYRRILRAVGSSRSPLSRRSCWVVTACALATALSATVSILQAV